MEVLIQIVSLTASLFAIALGVIAIWLATNFHEKTTELSAQTRVVLAQVEGYARETERGVRDLLGRLMDRILNVLERTRDVDMEIHYDTESDKILKLSAEKFDEALEAKAEQEKKKARDELTGAISSFLESFRDEIGRKSITWPREIVPLSAKPKVSPELGPESPRYNWEPFIRRLYHMELRHKFLSVKWLHKKRFSKNLRMQEALQIAIESDMLLTYTIDNPDNPQFPTTCCKLNREHAVVREILEDFEKKP